MTGSKIATLFLALTIGCASSVLQAEEPVSFKGLSPLSPAQVAGDLDRIIETELQKASAKPAGLVSDEDFLRRVSLDLIGVPPTAAEVTLFAFNPDSGKRAKLISQLLTERAYAENWSRYWRDVIFSRATEERVKRFSQPFENWMTDALAENQSWDEIATALLTATGDIQETGETALLMVHGGDPAEIAAETSRIFLGIQIQCANCHDHPTDIWKREDFHQLAAYFPRVQFRPVMSDGKRRSFEITSMPIRRGNGRRDPREAFRDPERLFAMLDRNRDGKIGAQEVKNSPLERVFDRIKDRIDADKDGLLTKAEFENLPAPMARPGQGSAEYFMPDLSNPASRGIPTEPVFFVNKTTSPEGLDDIERRALLAEQIVSTENPWFARAFVNRIWSELVGEGFAMPIDDMGPTRSPRFPDALDLLAGQFAAHEYNIKWLYETIALTSTYQRQLNEAAEMPFAASAPTRLRGESLYNAFEKALGLNENPAYRASQRQRRGAGGPYARQRNPRSQFAELFGYDPSTPQEEVSGTIPQALFLMNSPQVEGAIKSGGNTKLARILKQFEKDDAVVRELYLTVLSREPSAAELKLGLNFVKDTNQRTAAFEDLYWALLNSSEFLTKR